jgi:general secretion pathway protein D
VASGIPGLSDIPVIGRLFAFNRTETQATDIILTLTPHIVRVLDLTEADVRAFRMGRDTGAAVIETTAPVAPRPQGAADQAPVGAAAPASGAPTTPALRPMPPAPGTATPVKPPPPRPPGH